LGGRIAGETAAVEAMVKALGSSPVIRSVLTTGRAADEQQAREVLQLDIDASGAASGAIFDHVGRLRVAPERSEPASDGGPYDREVLLLAALEGRPGYRFTVNSSGARQFDVSYPVRGADGAVAGVAVLTKSLSELEASLKNFDTAFYFLNDRGEVTLTNRPERRGQVLWSVQTPPRASRPLFALPDQPLLAKEVIESQWTRFDGQRGYVLRRPVAHSDWSVVVTIPLVGFFASRFLGIVITLQFAVMALLYFFGREYGLRDNIRMEQRIELQELAAGLKVQASTDPLTGLFNRWKFNDGLADEIERFHRQHVPFSLVMYDIDRFKEVNDIHGHQTGDRVLVRCSSIVSHALRQNDLLARWGGEEFIVLLVGDGGDAAAMVAEKLRTLIARTEFDAVGHITCSFGVAECMVGDTPDRMIARADDALYRAKMNGRDRVELAPPPMVDSPSLVLVG
jgi:diguanylate cyclase (GGDEF)-like protein